ncbi:MAG TPA: ABC transporter permease [Paraburkholderia sp.]|nr:ABC transporter permease [Paraburkholderia sp.]
MSTITRAIPTRQRIAISATAVALVIGVWQLAGGLGWVDSLLLPPPTRIVQTAFALVRNGYQHVPLWDHVAVSVVRALSAFIVAILVGIPLGLWMGASPIISAALSPFVEFLRPLPKIALIPLTVVWLGIGEESKFFLIFISAVLSIIVGSSAAVAGVSRSRIRLARTLGANRRQIFFRVILPDTLPELFLSVRLSVGIGWTSLIAAEMVAATSGLGWMVVNAGNYLRTDVVVLGIFLLGVIGYGLDLLLVGVERVLVPWAGKE